MAQYLPLPDGSFVTIRENETPLQAYERATKEYPDAFGITPPAPQEGVGAAFRGGLEGLLSRARTGVEAIFDPEEAARRGLERGEDIGQRFAPGASLQRVKDVYAEQGLLPAAGEAISQIPSALAEQAPNIAATLASGRAGAVAGGRAGGARGALVGGVGGALAPSLLQLFGSNIERQAEAQAESGQPLDISRGAALAAAAPGAALEAAATFIPLGRTVVGKILGPKAEAALATGSKNNAKLVEAGLLRTLGTGTVVGAGLEVPTEVIQQMLERAQAGLDLTSDDALAEYGEAAYGAALVGGPFGAAGRIGQRSVAQGEIEQEQAQVRAEDAKKAAEEDRLAQEAEEAEKATSGYRLKINEQLVEKKDRLRELEQLLKDKTTDEDVKDEAKTEAKQLRKELGDLTKQMKESMTKAGIAPTVESALKRQKIQIEQKQPIVDDFGNVISADTALDVPLFDKQGRPVTRRTKDGKDVLKTVKGTLPEDLTPEQEVEGYERQTAKTFKYFAEREDALQRLRDAEEAERQKAYDDLQTQIKTMFEERQRLEEETGDVGDIIAAEAGKRREQKTKEVQQEMSINRMQRIVDELGLRAADLKITPDERAKIESFINEGVVNRFVTGALGIKGLGGRTVNAAQALPNIDARIQELQDERQKALVGTDPLLLDTGAPTKKGIRLMGVEAQLNELRRLRMVAEQQAPAETGAESAIEGTLQAAVSAQVESPAVDVEQGLPRVAYETRIAEADKKAARAFKDLLSFVDDLQRKRFFGGAPGLIEDARSTEEGLREQVKQSKGLIIDNLLEEVATARVARKLRPLSYSEAYLFIEDVAGLVDTLVERSLAAAPGMQTETITTPGQMRGTQLVSGATETEIDTRTERQLPFGATPRRQDIVAQMSEKQQQKIAKTFTTLRKNVKAALVKVEQIDATLNAMQPPKPVAKRGEPAPEPVQRRVVLPESPEAQRLADQRVKAVDALRKAEQALADERININASVRGVSQKQAVQTIRNVIRSIKESTIDEGKRPIRAEKPLLRQQFRTQEAETDYAQADRVVEEIDRVLAMPNLDPQVAQVLDRAATVIANENVNPTFLNTVDEQVGRILRGIDKPFTPVADPTQPARRPPADRQAMLINEIQQDIDNKVAVSAAAMQDITTQAQGDMFAEDLATIRATPGMFRRLQKSRKVVKKRERIADLKQLEKDLRVAKRNADADAAGALKLEEKNIFQEIIKLAENIKRDMGDDISVTNAQKFAALDDRIKKLVAEYKKKKPKEATSEVAENERILTKLLKEAATPEPFSLTSTSSASDFASNTQSIRARINALEIKIKEASSALMEVVNNPEIYEAKFKRKYGKGAKTRVDKLVDARTRFLEDAKKQLENFELIIKKTIMQPRSAAEKVELPTTAADLRAAKQALATRINAILLRLKEQDIKLTEDVRGFIGLGLNLPGIRFERKTPEEIAKDIAEARAERKAAIKAAGAKTKEQKAAIPLKLKSRFKVAAIKSAEEIEADRRKIQSGSFNPTLSPEDVQIKVQEEFDKALENRNKAKKELADFRKLVNEAKGAKDFAKYEKEFFTKLKELSAVVNVAQAKYVSARYNLDLINKTTIRDFKGRRETAPRTIAGPITQSQIKYTPEQLSMLTGMPANMLPRITVVDDDTTKFAIGDSKPETPVDFDEAEKRLKEIKEKFDKMMSGEIAPKKPEVDLTRRRLVQAAGVALATPKMPASIVKAFNVAELTPDAVWKAVTSGSDWFDSIVDVQSLEKLSKGINTTKLINLKGSALYDAMERIAGKEAALFIDSLEYADPIDVYLDDFIEANKNDPQILSKIQRGYDVAATDVFTAITKDLKSADGKAEQVDKKETAALTPAKKTPTLNFYPSVAEAPIEISRAMARQGLDPLTDSVKGGVLPNGDVFIIVDAHSDMLDLEQTIAHELIGHYSFESMLGKDGMMELMRKVDKSFATKKNENGLENLADSLGLGKQYDAAITGIANFYADKLAKGEITEKEVLRLAKTQGLREIIAYTMEKRVDQSFMEKAKRWLQELVGAFRALLKRMGAIDAANMSTSDLFYLMKQAHDNFTAGKPMAVMNSDGTVSFREAALAPAPQTGLSAMIARKGKVHDKIKSNVTGLAARVQFFDRLAALDALVKRGVEKGVIDSLKAMDVLYFSRMADQRNNFVAQFATSGVGKISLKDGERMYTGGAGPSLKDVSQALSKSGVPSKDVENEFTEYLLAVRAKRVGADKLDFTGKTATQKQVEDTVARYSGTDPVSMAFKEAQKLYRDYNNNLIDFVVSSGAMSKEKGEALKAPGDYVPFYRQVGGRVELVVMGEKPIRIGDITSQPYLQALVGGETTVLPVFTSALQNTSMLVDMALKNMAARNTAFVLRDMGVAKIQDGKGPDNVKVIRFSVEEKDASGKLKHKEKYAIIDTRMKEELFGDIPTELVVQGMEGIKAVIPAGVQLLGLPANWLRKFVTRDPRYAIRQIFRDSMASVLTTGANFVPLVQTLKDMTTMKKSGTLEKLRESGVVGGQVITGASDDMAKILQQIASGKPGWDMAMAKLDEFAMMGDAATRVSMYNSFLRQGLSDREATFATLEAMNFGRRGLSPTVLYANTLIPFFNAGLQGIDVLYRAFKGDMPFSERLQVKRKLLARGAIMALMTMSYAYAMEDEEEYKNANPDERYNNWFVPTPFGVLRVPIPFEAGLVFKGIPEGVYRMAFTDDKNADVLRALKDLALRSVPGDIPTAIKPLIELNLNKSFFTDREIVDAGLPEEAKYQYRPNTPELIKMFGSVGLSPVQVEYFIKGYTGSLLTGTMRIFDPVFGGELVKPDMRITDVPVLGGLFQPKDAGGLINAAYKTAQNAQAAQRTYNRLQQEDPEEARKYFQSALNNLSLASSAGQFKRQMSEITLAERSIRAAKTITGEEKREKLDDLRQEKIKIATVFNNIKAQIERQASRSGLQ
jgi:hypothetical protein